MWDKTKQSRLIESILIRLPLSAFYFDASNDNKWLVVDGLQRLSTFKNFIIESNKKKRLVLQNLEYLTQFNGYTFEDLPRELKRRIEEHEITVYIINAGTPNEVKFNLFKRLNTGGLTLNAQEIRNALNQGISTNFLIELSELKEFKQFGITHRKMFDINFVNQFLAFYLFPIEKYKPDLDDFLNEAMIKIRKITKNERAKIKIDFTNAMIRAEELFGKYAFRKRYKINDKKNRINKALFEIWSVTLSRLEVDEFNKIKENKNSVNRDFIELLKNNKDFEKSISTSTGDPKNVRIRFEEINILINKYL